MIFYLIPTAFIIVSLGLIIFIIVKNFPRLASVNVESIAAEKESRVRNRLMLDRLFRQWRLWQKRVVKLIIPLRQKVEELAVKFYHKTIELEKESLKKSSPLKKIDLGQEIKDKLSAAEKAVAEEDFVAAEETIIAVIGIDQHNLDAYELLVEVYTKNKDYRQARETARYLVKLFNRSKPTVDHHRLANAYADLGYIYQLEGRHKYSIMNFKKALELEPQNPRFLDLLLKISILVKDKNEASAAFRSLQEADPDNQKLTELKEAIDSLPEGG